MTLVDACARRLSTAPGVAEQGPWLLALAAGAALDHSIQEGQ